MSTPISFKAMSNERSSYKKKKSVFWIGVLEMPSIVMLSKQRKVDYDYIVLSKGYFVLGEVWVWIRVT